jgi:hypothetical protein
MRSKILPVSYKMPHELVISLHECCADPQHVQLVASATRAKIDESSREKKKTAGIF